MEKKGEDDMNNYHEIVSGSLQVAQAEAIEKGHTELTPLHLLWGLLNNPQSFVSRELSSKTSEVRDRLSKLPTAKKVDLEWVLIVL